MSTIVKHRAPGEVNTRALPTAFKPKHCAGSWCLHDHATDDRPSLGLHPSAFAPSYGPLTVVKDNAS